MQQKKLLHKLTDTRKGKWNLLFAISGMGLGVLLLLVSVQAYVNVHRLLYSSSGKAGMADFLIIHKKITAEMMGNEQATAFTPAEVAGIEKQPFIKAAGMITSNHFKVSASAGSRLQFYTDLFFESVPDSFLDVRPADWSWKESDRVLPVILSTDFLNLYNYGFALSQGLPQLSEATVKALPFTITVSGGGQSENFQANIVGFSDRISSILVPQNFMDWANRTFQAGGTASYPPSRLILKVDDPSNPAFVQYLRDHRYETNEDKLKFSRIRVIVQTVISAIGIFGLLVVLLALIIFSIYLQLMIARAREEIRLLITLGYSPRMLGRFLIRQIMPFYAYILCGGIAVTSLLQLLAFRFTEGKNLSLSPFISAAVPALAALIFVLFYLITGRSVKRQMADCYFL